LAPTVCVLAHPPTHAAPNNAPPNNLRLEIKVNRLSWMGCLWKQEGYCHVTFHPTVHSKPAGNLGKIWSACGQREINTLKEEWKKQPIVLIIPTIEPVYFFIHRVQ
jgi:hypothetical protein